MYVCASVLNVIMYTYYVSTIMDLAHAMLGPVGGVTVPTYQPYMISTRNQIPLAARLLVESLRYKLARVYPGVSPFCSSGAVWFGSSGLPWYLTAIM